MHFTSVFAAASIMMLFGNAGRDQATKDGPNNPPAIRKALDEKITLDYNGVSLEDAVEHLQKKTNIKMVLDYFVIEQMVGGSAVGRGYGAQVDGAIGGGFGNPGFGIGAFPGGIGGIGGIGGAQGVFGGVGGIGGGAFGNPGGNPIPGIQAALVGTPGFPPKLPLKIDNGKVRTALQNLINHRNLTFVILGDTVVITTEEAGQLRQLRQRISVDVKNQPLSDALKKLADDTGIDLIIDERQAEKAKTKINLQLEGVSLETAVRLMTEFADLTPVSVGNVLLVTSDARVEKLRKENPANSNLDMRFAAYPGGLPPLSPGGLPLLSGGREPDEIPDPAVQPPPPKK